MIVGGVLGAGQRFNEQQIASDLGVSRGPVREAVRAMVRAGLAAGVPNIGMFVRQDGIEEAVELYKMRGLVFGFACARLAERATADQVNCLRETVDMMDRAIADEDGSEYYRLNLEFHDLVLAYSDHKYATKIYDALVKEDHLLRERSLQIVASMRESNADHKRIVDAIAAGDRNKARSTAEEHHVQGKRRWLDMLGRKMRKLRAQASPRR